MIPRPISARRLRRSRTQASAHSEVPCSALASTASTLLAVVLISVSSLELVAQAGIDPQRDQVGDQVERHEQEGEKHHVTHAHEQVAVESGLDVRLPNAWNAK